MHILININKIKMGKLRILIFSALFIGIFGSDPHQKSILFPVDSDEGTIVNAFLEGMGGKLINVKEDNPWDQVEILLYTMFSIIY